MGVKLLTEHHFEFLSLKEAAEAHPSLHLSKCQIVGNLIPAQLFHHHGHLTICPLVSSVDQHYTKV